MNFLLHRFGFGFFCIQLESNHILYEQMLLERQHVEPSPTPAIDSTMPPPSYEEVNNLFVSHMNGGSTDAMGYFLGEVT